MSQLTLPKEKIKVVLLEGVHRRALECFQESGYVNIESLDGAFDGGELAAAIADAHIVGIRSRTQLDAEALRAAGKLFAVGCFCIGTNQVDLGAAKLLGVPVFNAPFSNTRSVAELVIAETIFLMRGVAEKNSLAHRGVWRKSTRGSHEARGKTIGIIGYGHIGSQVSVLAEALGMNVVFYDIENKLRIGNAVPMSGMAEVLAASDVVTLHIPANESTRGLIGAAAIAAMRPGALLINAARGEVVDIAALAGGLESGQIGGAALDVFPEEPASEKEPFESPLRRFDNIILTPHIGGSTEEAQENIALEVAGKLVKYSDNGSTSGGVNFPEVSLPTHSADKSRFLHIHRNQPGVLEAVNKVFSSRGINIAAQYLQTESEVGYLICDVVGKIESSIFDKLKNIPHTIRARRLF